MAKQIEKESVKEGTIFRQGFRIWDIGFRYMLSRVCQYF